MKNITIAGGITRDATMRTTQDGDKVTGFSVAVSEGFGDKKRTLYFDCSIWGKRAETLAPMLVKGGKVCVSGDFSTRDHDGKTYLTLRANEVTLQSARQDRDDEPRREASPARRDDLDASEIPF
jgi:single-strand DNA-binding protein